MKSGTIAVVGRANAGKSTLINVLVGEKVSIVSPKPQTTRDRILGVLNGDGYQIVFADTPGLYKSQTRLSEIMQKTAETTVRDVDIILYAIDGHKGVTEDDVETLKRFSSLGAPLVVVLTKTDIMQEENLPKEVLKLNDITLERIIPISARKGKNIHKLLETLVKLLKEGEPIYGTDVISDKSERFMLAEIMREKLLLKYDKEIPHGIAIIINKYEIRKNGIADVNLDIVCEKQNHKAILIGKQGKSLKEVSTFAREGMEKFLERKVFLTVFVKVKEDWRDREQLVKEFGYFE